jgi:tetratricopeptide (TPR) repeat protein
VEDVVRGPCSVVRDSSPRATDHGPRATSPSSTLDLLSRLADKSVLFASQQEEEARYGMLETVREYAFERLEESGEADAMMRRHAEYFRSLADAAEPKLVSPEAATWLARLEAEHVNLQAALGWLLERDPDACVRLAAALGNFWFLHGHYAEGRRWLDAALEHGRTSPAGVAAKALVGAGMIARQQGDLAAARAYFERGLEAGDAAGDPLRTAWASLNLGIVAMVQGDLPAARAHAEETLARATGLGLDQVAGSSLMLLGEMARLEGDWAAARPFYEQALEINRRIGHMEGVSVTLNNLGATLCELGDLEGTHACYGEALAIAEELGTRDDIACALEGLGAAASKGGDWVRAGRLAGAAEALREAIGSALDPTDGAMRERSLAAARAALGEAALEAAIAEGRAMTLPQAIACARATARSRER